MSWSKWFSYTLLMVAIPSLLISLVVEDMASFAGLEEDYSLMLYTVSLIMSFSLLSAVMRKFLVSKGLTPSFSTKTYIDNKTVISNSFLKEMEKKLSKVDKEEEPERYVHLASMLGMSYLQNAIAFQDREMFTKALSLKEEIEKFLKSHKVKPEARTMFEGFKSKIEHSKGNFK
ncbi:hypothetical protein IC006_0386 [Sulfuracidifex tepidarius]|uniref:Uncharacterized protein n=2 Tax=Sulfuracidifex tepidarius TaxID=1294262 RepID=A0A510E0Z4_9CREN|nr:hypothetical protein IC006_0386 [Sulfuracidifex tepidarius]BBG25850.1 hypothetical protein IC007_0355 [Sulfuracidifex tepidarius]